MKTDKPTMTKAEANYRPGRPGHRCGECSMFRKPDSCTLVMGEIRPDRVCDYFEKR